MAWHISVGPAILHLRSPALLLLPMQDGQGRVGGFESWQHRLLRK